MLWSMCMPPGRLDPQPYAPSNLPRVVVGVGNIGRETIVVAKVGRSRNTSLSRYCHVCRRPARHSAECRLFSRRKNHKSGWRPLASIAGIARDFRDPHRIERSICGLGFPRRTKSTLCFWTTRAGWRGCNVRRRAAGCGCRIRARTKLASKSNSRELRCPGCLESET